MPPPIDIPATLKLYSRNTLFRMVAILSLHYGNMHVPDNERSLFSDCSKKHIPHINELFQLYYMGSVSSSVSGAGPSDSLDMQI